MAWYFKQHKPKSRVLILDANEEVVSKKALFMKAWAAAYQGIVEYRPQSELRDVDVANRTAILNSTGSGPTCSTWCRRSVPARSRSRPG